MKYIHLTLAFSLMSLAISAQITINTSDVPSIGTTYYFSVDTLLAPDTSPGPDGTGVTWDFTGDTASFAVTNAIVAPEDTPAADLFPDATFAIQIGDEGNYAYSKVDENGLYGIGGIALMDGSTFALSFDPDQLLILNPTTFGTTFTTDYGSFGEFDGSDFGLDSLRIRQVGTAEVTCDASGTAIVPAGEFEVLRLRTDNMTIDSVWIKFFGTWSFFGETMTETTTYEWWGEGGIGNVALLELDEAGNPVQLLYLDSFSMPIAPPEVAFSAELVGNGSLSFTDLSTNDPTTWLWDFGDGNTSAEQNPTHTYAENGAYTVCLTATNEGGSTTSCEVFTILLSSTQDGLGADRSITVYPNPVVQSLYLTSTKMTEGEVRIYNTNGQVVYQRELVLSDDPTELSVHFLPRGTYWLELQGQDGYLNRLSFIKQ